MSVKAELQQVMDRMALAYRSRDAAACAAMFTKDAEVHSPYAPPARGRAAIQTLNEDWTSEPTGKRFDVLDAGHDGKLAWALCRYSEGDKTGDGTSLIVFEQQPDGTWLARMCALHGDTNDSHP